jgi:hypothetical protein
MEEGYALLQLLPKMTLRLWGKVGKVETPFPKSVTPSWFCEGSPLFIRGSEMTLLNQWRRDESPL